MTVHYQADSTTDKTLVVLSSFPLFFYCIVKVNGLLSIKLDLISFNLQMNNYPKWA